MPDESRLGSSRQSDEESEPDAECKPAPGQPDNIHASHALGEPSQANGSDGDENRGQGHATSRAFHVCSSPYFRTMIFRVTCSAPARSTAR